MKLLWDLNSDQSVVGERLASHPDLSRSGRKTEGEILNFDILVCQRDWASVISSFRKLEIDQYQAIRVQDLGVFQFLLQETDYDIHLNLETGHHNLAGVLKWCEVGQGRVKRVVLSHEIPAEKLRDYILVLKKINVEIELLISGPVLLFYSPRSLLTASFGTPTEVAIADSYESPHKGFRIIENKHGTFKYHLKDLFLWDRVEALEMLGLDWARVDVSHLDQSTVDGINSFWEFRDIDKLKSTYPVATTRGYFDTNKSDVLFPKLKNENLRRVDMGFVGAVLEANKGNYLAIEILGEQIISEGQVLKFITPEGKRVECVVNKLKSLSDSLTLMNYSAKIPVRSAVYV